MWSFAWQFALSHIFRRLFCADSDVSFCRTLLVATSSRIQTSWPFVACALLPRCRMFAPFASLPLRCCSLLALSGGGLGGGWWGGGMRRGAGGSNNVLFHHKHSRGGWGFNKVLFHEKHIWSAQANLQVCRTSKPEASHPKLHKDGTLTHETTVGGGHGRRHAHPPRAW